MKMNLSLPFALSVLLLSTAPTEADVGCLLTTITQPVSGNIVVYPDGSGRSLDNKNYVVHIQLINDCTGLPVVGYPAEGLWLGGTGDSNYIPCPGRNMADAPTDSNGMTSFSAAPAGGGYTEQTVIYISGVASLEAPFDLRMISPDFNADLAVNLSDWGDFAADFNAGGSPRSDMNGNESNDIVDVGDTAAGVGTSCSQ